MREEEPLGVDEAGNSSQLLVTKFTC